DKLLTLRQRLPPLAQNYGCPRELHAFRTRSRVRVESRTRSDSRTPRRTPWFATFAISKVHCSWNFVHRNAPGAISARAFPVTPAKGSDRFISPAMVASATCPLRLSSVEWDRRRAVAPDVRRSRERFDKRS